MSDRKPMRALVIAIVISAAVNLAGSTLFVWSSYQARQQNCENVREAFDGYTDALAATTGRAPDDPEVAAFRAAYAPQLEECH